MKISTTSWHYRYLMWFEISAPQTLCIYFWALVFTGIVVPIVMSAFACIALVTAPIWGSIWLLKRGIKYLRRHAHIQVPGAGVLEIGWGYAKAAKRHVCPLIDYID